MVPRVGDQQLIFTSLPFDILCEVVMGIDYADMLALRLSCKVLQEVTKARQIWSKFIDDLVRDHKITPPEEEIESYTVEELEKWAATRNRAKDLRQGQRQLRFRSRILEEDGERIDWVGRGQILPGGRWLLASHNRYMYFYDLGAPLLESQVLLNSETMEEATVEYCVPWVDRSKERLTFFVATRVASPNKSHALVHCVELVGHGAAATLSANTLVTFGLKKRQETITSLFGVNDRYYIEIWGGLAYVCRYQEPFVQEGSSNKSLATLPFRTGGSLLGFIHHNMFAFYAGQDLHLFEIAPHESSRPPHAIRLLHTVSSVEFDLLSGIRWMPGASHMVFLDKGLLRGVHIPHDKALPPILVEIGRCKPHYRTTFLSFEVGALGISTSLLTTGSGSLTVEVVTHCWNDSGRQGDLIRKPALMDIPGWAGLLIPVMWSDDLSRMLLLVCSDDNSRNVLLVLDLT